MAAADERSAVHNRRIMSFNKEENGMISKDAIISNFQMRLLFQSRVSQNLAMLFPIRTIRDLWSKEAYSWASCVVANIYLILEKDGEYEEMQIKDIESFAINEDSSVTVVANGINYQLQTSYSDPFERISVVDGVLRIIDTRDNSVVKTCQLPQGYSIDAKWHVYDSQKKCIMWHVKPMKVSNIRDIVIDHEIPISVILQEKAKELSQLSELSELYKQASQQCNCSLSSKNIAKVTTFIKESKYDGMFRKVGFPLKELNEIASYKLILMQNLENLRKSDK